MTPAVVVRGKSTSALLTAVLTVALLCAVCAPAAMAGTFERTLFQESPLFGAAAATSETAATPDAADAEAAAVSPLAAPHITVSGQALSWTPVSGVSSYVFVRKVTGQADQYSNTTATSVTPAAAPGKAVRFSVRTNVSGSAWAAEVSITYPASQTVPVLRVSGQSLSWTAISGVTSYVLLRRISGQADLSTTVSGTSSTPAAVAGKTAAYTVRTNVTGSAASNAVSITYPATPPPPPSVPVLRVSGQTLSWTAVSGVSSYVLLRRISGQADLSTTVSGTSSTPAAVAGKTAAYTVRTNVTGSASSNAVSITYPATPPPPPPPPPGAFAMGVVAGSVPSYELQFASSLRAHSARLMYEIGTSASSMASVIDAYARAGVRPLLCANFHGRLPSTAEAQNLASWARAYGPGGTFWQGKSYPANTAVTRIEFGSETSYSYQFADYSLPTYSARAKTYALRFKDAQVAIKAANPNVGVLAQGDNAVNQTAWVVNMFRAVPDLGTRAAGWTIHPYGPNWKTRIDSTVNSTKAAGSPDLPIWVTEWGVSTDNGRCLSDNYGYNKCMSYTEAATVLHAALTGMQSTYGSRLGGFYLYQAHDQYATGTRTGRESYFGALQSRGQAKGAFTTEVKADLAAHP